MKINSCSIPLFRTFRRLVVGLALILCFMASANAASDADVTYFKVKKVTIEETSITIVVEEAKTHITLIKDDHDPAYTGDQWHGGLPPVFDPLAMRVWYGLVVVGRS